MHFCSLFFVTMVVPAKQITEKKSKRVLIVIGDITFQLNYQCFLWIACDDEVLATNFFEII